MDSTVLALSDIKSKVATVAKSYNIKKIDMFGSYACGNQTKKSDIDLLVEFNDKSSVTLFQFFRVQRELEKSLGRKVDLVAVPIPKESFIVIDRLVPIYE